MLTVVVDEHGKAAGVMSAFFGAGEHQVNVGVAVRDEALHAVLLYGRGKCPPRFSPGPALIVIPFGITDKTRPGRVLRYPYCGCSGAAPATPGSPAQMQKTSLLRSFGKYNADD